MTVPGASPSLARMARLRLGLIGVGRHGLRYVRHIREDFPGLELTALWRRDHAAARQQASDFGCRAFADIGALVAADDVDAVIAVVPPSLHRAIVGAAAAAAKPLLLEKPAAVSIADGEAMRAAVARSGSAVMVAQTLRFNGVVRAIHAARERIGRIHGVRLSQRFEASRPGWIDDPDVAGGGVMLHTGVHSFDMMRFLSDMEAVSVACSVASVGTARTEDNFVATVRLSQPQALASVSGSRATASRSGPIELAGEHGQLIGDHVLNTACLVRSGGIEPLEVPPPVPTVREALGAFVHAVERGAEMPITLDDGLRAIAVVMAGYESARSGAQAEVHTWS